jgi:hypothetical protein
MENELGESEGYESSDGYEYSSEPAQETSEPRLSGYAKSFLETVPEEHRPVLQNYLPQWDSNFTKYAQKVQGELKGYRELGDYETLTNSRRLYDTLLNQPQVIYDYLVNQGYGKQEARAIAEEMGSSEEPDPTEQRLAEYEKYIAAMASWIQNQETMSQEAYEREMLETTMEELKQQYGEYDRTWVLRAIAAGADPEEAVQEFHQLVQNVVNQRAKAPAPKVLSGSGLPPVNKPDLANASSKDTKDYLTKMLSEMSRE